MIQGFMKPRDAWYALNSTIIMKLTWHAAVLTLSQKDWDHIMAPALSKGLQKSRINGNMKRLFVYAPNRYLGFGVTDPYLKQIDR